MSASIRNLQDRLSALRTARFNREMSDDFAFTNGSLRRIDTEMDAVRAQLIALGVVA